MPTMLCRMDAELFLIAGDPKFGDLLLLSVAMLHHRIGVLNNVVNNSQSEPTRSWLNHLKSAVLEPETFPSRVKSTKSSELDSEFVEPPLLAPRPLCLVIHSALSAQLSTLMCPFEDLKIKHTKLQQRKMAPLIKQEKRFTLCMGSSDTNTHQIKAKGSGYTVQGINFHCSKPLLVLGLSLTMLYDWLLSFIVLCLIFDLQMS